MGRNLILLKSTLKSSNEALQGFKPGKEKLEALYLSHTYLYHIPSGRYILQSQFIISYVAEYLSADVFVTAPAKWIFG